MTDNFYTFVLSPIVVAVIGGLSYFAKWMLAKRDKKHEEEITERNRRRDEIENRLSKAETRQAMTEKKLSRVIALIIGCDKPDCPTRSKLSEFISNQDE